MAGPVEIWTTGIAAFRPPQNPGTKPKFLRWEVGDLLPKPGTALIGLLMTIQVLRGLRHGSCDYLLTSHRRYRILIQDHCVGDLWWTSGRESVRVLRLLCQYYSTIPPYCFSYRPYTVLDVNVTTKLKIPVMLPPLWSSGQSFWLQIQRSRFRFPALPDFLSSSWSGTGSTQPREVNWGATWIKK